MREEIDRLPQGPLAASGGTFARRAFVIVLVEGWRGEIAHLAVTNADGDLQAYRIADPSLHNWFGLAVAMRGQQISDFPLCNKSFNLSYAGHDRSRDGVPRDMPVDLYVPGYPPHPVTMLDGLLRLLGRIEQRRRRARID